MNTQKEKDVIGTVSATYNNEPIYMLVSWGSQGRSRVVQEIAMVSVDTSREKALEDDELAELVDFMIDQGATAEEIHAAVINATAISVPSLIFKKGVDGMQCFLPLQELATPINTIQLLDEDKPRQCSTVTGRQWSTLVNRQIKLIEVARWAANGGKLSYALKVI